MSLSPNSVVRNVFGITDEEKACIRNYLQGAVYSWVKNRKNEQFAARDLVGGENSKWDGTPLLPLFRKHKDKGKAYGQAIRDAGIDLGWLLKAVLNEDKRTFVVGRSGRTVGYQWVGNEP